jgi:pilus assembly protein Flp/PilA
MTRMLRALWRDEEGASLIEYVLIAGLISVAGYLFMQTIGADLTAILTQVSLDTTAAR